jgi:hypothetical protein
MLLTISNLAKKTHAHTLSVCLSRSLSLSPKENLWYPPTNKQTVFQLQTQKKPSTFLSELAQNQSSELTGWSSLRLCLYLSSSTLSKTQISHALLQGKKKQTTGSLVSILRSHMLLLSLQGNKKPQHTKGWMLSSQQHSNLTCTYCSSRKEKNPTQLNPTQQTHKVQSCRGFINTIRSHKLSLLEETPPKKPQLAKNQTSEERKGSSFFPCLF